MPPPLRCAYIISSPSLCPKSVYRTSQSRSFSSSPPHAQRVGRNRRALFRWLNTVGTNFEKPASGSTNYLSAYTAEGKLRRTTDDSETKDKEKSSGSSGEKKEGKKGPPPETGRDLRPFPLNRSFRSQPVLGEQMREKIWESVMLDGWSVRQTSAQLGVEMSRVGAVLRLKEIEKEWKRIVSQTTHLLS